MHLLIGPVPPDPSGPHRIWAIPELLSLVLQQLDPPSLLQCLTVSAGFHRSALRILYHTPRLRSSADVLSFFGCDVHAGLEGRARRREALRWVREVVLETGCVPEEHHTLAHLKRTLATLGAGREDLLLPRLKMLRLEYSLEGWTQLVTPIINASSASLGRLDSGVEVLSARSPPLVGPGLFELFSNAQGIVLSAAQGMQGETHVHLLPSQKAQLLAFLAPLHGQRKTWAFDRIFFHAVRQRYHPLPTFLLERPLRAAAEECALELHFGPLAAHSCTTPGLSLNPWDRRLTLLSHAASLASKSVPVVVHGVPPAHIHLSPVAEGLTYVLPSSPSQPPHVGAEEDADAVQQLPTLSDAQVGALFYRSLGVGWAALAQGVMSLGGAARA